MSKANGYKEKLKEIQKFELEDSEFGIQTCMSFSKMLISFFYETRSNINLNDKFSSLNFVKHKRKENNTEKYVEGTDSKYFHFPLATYLSGFSQALLISLINTQEDAKDFNIYTINSIHGANLSLLNKDKKGNYILEKASNKFLSNINYLLAKQHPYKVLRKIRDATYKHKKSSENSNNLENILNLYNNFLGLDYFFILMENYQNKDKES
jgi:hypothetical protein